MQLKLVLVNRIVLYEKYVFSGNEYVTNSDTDSTWAKNDVDFLWKHPANQSQMVLLSHQQMSS